MLAGILLLAAFLNGYNIRQETYANTYYTVSVASMLVFTLLLGAWFLLKGIRTRQARPVFCGFRGGRRSGRIRSEVTSGW
uniref:Uncharacterized protein n=1 Tax=Cohnella candidum TaxID=2674991 RepID=A0A3G3JT14_9BACL|nr:hypothetical protein EAV92_01245 [Cohnella candidum]